MKKALITGITGQDGSYLAEFLLDKGYEVHGLFPRRSTDSSFERIRHIKNKLRLHSGDMIDGGSIEKAVRNAGEVDEIYNLAAQSHVGDSFIQPEATSNVNYHGLLRIFEAVAHLEINPRIYQASTSELFGNTQLPHNEQTPMVPVSPYAVSKLHAHKTIQDARNGRLSLAPERSFYACAGILFNHEGPRRGIGFVTRKISHGLAEIVHGSDEKIPLGNLDAKRDWGYAPDYVKAMWLMLQQEKPDDYVVATGETHSVREFFEEACKNLNLAGPIERYFVIDPDLLRPAEVHALYGDARKARDTFGWKPTVGFKELVKIMTDHDYKLVEAERERDRILSS